ASDQADPVCKKKGLMLICIRPSLDRVFGGSGRVNVIALLESGSLQPAGGLLVAGCQRECAEENASCKEKAKHHAGERQPVCFGISVIGRLKIHRRSPVFAL